MKKKKKKTRQLSNINAKGFPITKILLLDKVALYIKSSNIPNNSNDGRPERYSIDGFLRPNPNFSLRTLQNLNQRRCNLSE